MDISFDYLRPGESNGSAINHNEEDPQAQPGCQATSNCQIGDGEHTAESKNEDENSLSMIPKASGMGMNIHMDVMR